MKTIYFVFFILLCSNDSLQAQSWQWGKSGGASDEFTSFNEEEVKSTSVDVYGNIYIVSDVGRVSLQVDGHPKDTYAEYGLNDGVLTSFGCDGSYRWSKVIGGALGAYLNRIDTDGLGNVYAIGQVSRVSPSQVQVHFDTDVVLPSSESNLNTYKKTMFIIKYDKNGVFQWLRMPEADDVSASQITYTNAIDIQVDAQGNCFWLCHLPIGVYANGAYTVTTPSFHILKYDATGNFTGGFALNIVKENAREFVRMKRNSATGAIYIAGDAYQQPFSPLVYINGELFTHSVYLAAFSSTGAFLWKKENQSVSYSGAGFSFDVDIDLDNNIYFATTVFYNVVGNDFLRDAFNGVPVSMGDYSTPVPLLVKLDPNGNTLWQTNGNRSYLYDVKVNGNEVAVCGSVGSNSQWESLSYTSANNAPHPYIARFNKNTGAIIAINAIETTGLDDIATSLAIDSKGNYYIGGKFESTMSIGSSTLNNSGGDTDFFISKFGTTDCNFLATEQPEEQKLKLYPNPVKDYLHLENVTNSTYVLYDVLGTVVAKGVVSENSALNFSQLSSGLYVLEVVKNTGEKTVVKVLKE